MYYTSFFDIEDTIFNNLPSELDELHFNNLRYNTLNNLPPYIKKIYFNWNHCMRGYNQNKRKKILKNILDNSKIPFDCEIISDYL